MVKTKGAPLWQIIGKPPGGTISAMGITQQEKPTIFVGAGAGLHRSKRLGKSEPPEWERLPMAPLGIMSLAISPNYTIDHTLVAGTHAGIYLSRDGGDTWQEARLPLSTSMVLALIFSPDFARDSILLAGTLEDGVLFSDTRGESWTEKNFGLLDATVYALAASPTFAQDGIAFAGTESALYYTYNRALAWRPLPFPEKASPVLSLAVSPGFPEDGTLYAGTEQEGLYRSTDRGQSWQRLELPAVSVNALLAPQQRILLAATEAGVFHSNDQGETWECLLDRPDVLNLAVQGDLLLAGLVDQGVWMKNAWSDWRPVENLSIRSFTSLALSDQFEQDGTAFICGSSEGIWKTVDSGYTWQTLNAALPSLEIHAMALSPNFSKNRILAAACAEGLLLSQDAGEAWQTVVEGQCTSVAFSPDGRLLTAAFSGALLVSTDLGKSWEAISGSWQAVGKVIAMSLAHRGHLVIAHLESDGETISLWQGKFGQLEKILSQPAGDTPLVSFWLPAEAAAGRPWYASLGNKVWKFSARAGAVVAESMVFPSDQTEKILALAGVQGPAGMWLFACSGQRLYRSLDGKEWEVIHDFGAQRAISFGLPSSFLESKTVYALLLGGMFCKGVIR